MDHRITLAECEDDYRQSAELLTVSEPWSELKRTFEYSLAKVSNPDSKLYVVNKDSEVLGCLILEPYGPLKCFVRALCIKEGYRGRHLGSALLKHVEDEVFTYTKNVFLFCEGERRLRFYKDNGYQTVGELKDYNKEGLSEYIMRKTTGPLE